MIGCQNIYITYLHVIPCHPHTLSPYVSTTWPLTGADAVPCDRVSEFNETITYQSEYKISICIHHIHTCDNLSLWHPTPLFCADLRGSIAFVKQRDRVPEHVHDVLHIYNILSPWHPTFLFCACLRGSIVLGKWWDRESEHIHDASHICDTLHVSDILSPYHPDMWYSVTLSPWHSIPLLCADLRSGSA